MEPKQPSYYRDLLESIMNESNEWINKVSSKYGDELSIYMDINHPITIGEDTVVLTRIEVPLTSNWDGTMGAYFMDQDFDALRNIENPTSWAQLEKSIGNALGLGQVKLSAGTDFWEPLDGGDDPGVRPILPGGTTKRLLGQYIAAAGKDKILRILLKMIKDRGDVRYLMLALEQQHVDWPELNAIKKSLNASR